MEPYDAEFRGEVLAACDANGGTRTIAVRFKVSDSYAVRWEKELVSWSSYRWVQLHARL